MKKYLIIIFFLILISTKSSAQIGVGIKAGGNYSPFRTTKSEAQIGGTISVFKEFRIYKTLNVSFEFMYSNKKGILKNKILGGSYKGLVYLENIHYSLGYFELPFLLQNYHTTYGLKFFYYIGPSFYLQLFDMTEKEIVRYLGEVREWDEWDNYEYDYLYILDRSGPYFNNGACLNLGFGLTYRHLLFDFRYSYDIHKIEAVGRAEMNESLHSFHFLFGLIL